MNRPTLACMLTLALTARSPSSLVATTYPPPPCGKCSITRLYAIEITITVAAITAANASAKYVCCPSVRNASSGPYAEEESPSAPSPTHASSATSDTL